MGYNLLINGVYWGYNPFTNHLLNCWDIQVEKAGLAKMPDQTVRLDDLQLPEMPGVEAFMTVWKRRLGEHIDWNHFKNVLIFIYIYIHVEFQGCSYSSFHSCLHALRFRLAIKDHTPEAPGCFRSFWGASRVLESLPFGFRREKEMKKRACCQRCIKNL